MYLRERLRDFFERSFYRVKPKSYAYLPEQARTSDTLIVVPYFNFLNDKIRSRIYDKFKNELLKNIFSARVLVAEAIAGSELQNAEIKSLSENVVHLKCFTPSILWQKERLLNLSLDYAQKNNFKNFVWLDADIQLLDPYWVPRLAVLLEKYQVLQCFETALLEEDLEGGKFRAKASIVSSYLHKHNLKNKGLASGLAWAAKVDALLGRRFFDAAIVGGGDTAFYYALLGSFLSHSEWCRALSQVSFFQNLPPKLLASFHAWVDGSPKETIKIGILEQNIKAFYHGKQYLRQKRGRYLGLQDFDPQHELQKTNSGAWQWSALADPKHIKIVEDFFHHRSKNLG